MGTVRNRVAEKLIGYVSYIILTYHNVNYFVIIDAFYSKDVAAERSKLQLTQNTLNSQIYIGTLTTTFISIIIYGVVL